MKSKKELLQTFGGPINPEDNKIQNVSQDTIAGLKIAKIFLGVLIDIRDILKEIVSRTDLLDE